MSGSGIFPIPPGTWTVDGALTALAVAWSTDKDVRVEVRPLTWGKDIALFSPFIRAGERWYESTEMRVDGERFDITAPTGFAIREAVFTMLRSRGLLREDLP